MYIYSAQFCMTTSRLIFLCTTEIYWKVSLSQWAVEKSVTNTLFAQVLVFHAPKHKEGLQLKDKQGTVKSIVKKFQGKELSANLPYKVEFILPTEGDGKDLKVVAHLVSAWSKHIFFRLSHQLLSWDFEDQYSKANLQIPYHLSLHYDFGCSKHEHI